MNIKTTDTLLKSNEDIDQFLDQLSSKKIIVYPAGILGQQLQKTLLEYDKHISYFIDRAYDNLKSINGVSVQSPDLLNDLDPSKFQIIISVNWDTQFEIFKKVVLERNHELQIHNGWSLNRILKMSICSSRIKEKKMIDIFECENCGFERHHCPVASACLKEMGNHVDFEDDRRSKSFDWFGCIVGQECTLRCEHCCEQVPLLKDKGFAPVESILSDVRQMAKASHFLNFVELIGGEPFLHPKIEELITGLLNIENIGYIKSFTNGTVIPSDRLCDIINNPRFMLQISNYEKVITGKLLKNIQVTKKKLEEYGVTYIFTQNSTEWLDLKDFKKHEAKSVYLKKAFKSCFLNICHRVYKGKLYRCPHHYTGIQLGKLKEYSHECIDIHSYNIDNLSNALEHFEHLPFMDACRYCELPFSPKPVPAGIQLPRSKHK